MTVELNSSNFEQITSKRGIVLVRGWASWCRNCDEFAEAFGRAAANHPDHVLATLDTQKEKDLRSALGIEHIPCLMVYRDGLLLFKQAGSYDENALNDIIAQAESIEMERVRAAMASTTSEPEAKAS